VGRPGTDSRRTEFVARKCSFDNAHDVLTQVIDRGTMSDVVTGPAIIEDAWSTVVVPPGWQAVPDATGNLYLTKVAS
jgi:N-methylhydantoinase A